MTTQERITKQELIDRNLMQEIYRTKFNFQQLEQTPTDISCHYDLFCKGVNAKGKSIKWNTEIKQLNGDYKDCIIKTDKIDRMFNATPDGIGLFYAAICPEDKKMYIFNCKKRDWTKTAAFPLYQWICEEDHSKGKAEYYMYKLPKKEATYTIDLSEEQLKPFINANS